VVLVEDGQPRSTIVVDDAAGPSERFAAEELSRFVEEMSGAKLPSVKPEGAPEAKPGSALIVVGAKAAAKLRIEADLAGLGDEGFVIKALKDRVLVAGGEKRGTLFGAYTLLEKLGCRWWTPTESTIPKNKTIVVPALDAREVPKFEYRDIMYLDLHTGIREDGTLWGVRNKLNGAGYRKAVDKYGGLFLYAPGLIHSYAWLLGRVPKAGYDTNEALWGLYQGKRNRTQPCLTNPDVVKAMTESALGVLREHPEYAFVTVGQNDGGEHCECETCKALSESEKEGTTGAPVIALANQVAEAAAKEFPKATINASAYGWSRKPPANLKPRENVMVALSSIETDFGHPLATGENQENVKFRQDIEGWNRIVKRLYIWDYTTNFGHWLMPWPNLDAMVPNVKFYADHKAAGYFAQGSHTGRFTEFAPLRMWVLAKAAWNPEADGKALIAEFLSGYYGPAAGPIQKYIDTIHKPVRENKPLHVPCGGSSKLEGPWLEPEVLAEAESHMREAEKAVAGDAVLSKRVRHAHMPIWYVLVRRDIQFANCGQKSATWRAMEARVGNVEFADVALDLAGAVRENGINSFGEHAPIHPWIDWLEDHAKLVKAKAPMVPPELEKADPKPSVLVHGGLTDLPPLDHPWYRQQWKGLAFGPKKDAEACDGWVVETGTTWWFVRYPLKSGREFAAGKKYKLTVRVKPALKAKEGPGFGCGIGRKADPLAKWFSAKDLADGKFQTLEVGEIAMDEEGGSFWIALAKDSALSKVALDCFWLTEAR
jgi:hypothetical protein